MDEAVRSKIEQFFAAFPVHRCVKGEILVQAGDAPRGVMYLISGQVKEYDISAQGSEVVVNVFQPPAFFPMSWAMTGLPNQYFYEAAEDTSYHLAPAAEVVAYLKHNPDVLYDLLVRVYRGTEGLQRRMAHLMGGTARSRVLYELIIESKRFGTRQSDGSVRLAIHEDELANRAGLSRETINREVAKLKREKLLILDHGDLIICNLSQLETALGANL